MERIVSIWGDFGSASIHRKTVRRLPDLDFLQNNIAVVDVSEDRFQSVVPVAGQAFGCGLGCYDVEPRFHMAVEGFAIAFLLDLVFQPLFPAIVVSIFRAEAFQHCIIMD